MEEIRLIESSPTASVSPGTEDPLFAGIHGPVNVLAEFYDQAYC